MLEETLMAYLPVPEGLGPIIAGMEKSMESFTAEEMRGMDTNKDTTRIIEELADNPEGLSPITAEMEESMESFTAEEM